MVIIDKYDTLILGAGAAGLIARPDHGGSVRLDESGHAPHVDSVRRVLFRHAISSGHSAHRASFAAHCGHRSNARQYAARDEPRTDDAANGNPAGVVRCALCSLPAHLPLEISHPGRHLLRQISKIVEAQALSILKVEDHARAWIGPAGANSP